MNAEQLSKVQDWEQLPDELKIQRLNHTPADKWVETVTFIADALKQYDVDGFDDGNTDATHEIADGLVPIYTAEKWAEMNELSLWAVDEVESDAYELLEGAEDDGDPLFKVINAYLYAYYYRVTDLVVRYLVEEQEATEGED